MNKIFNSDCLNGMKKLVANSIDAVITDPPYGYGILQKTWDKVLPSIDIWKECLRVLKPGGWCFVMSAPRQDVLSRMIVNLEDAGFEIWFSSLYWSYATGFPKAMNISKAIDRRGGVDIRWFGEYLEKMLKEKGLNQSDLAMHFLSKNGGRTGCVHNWITGKNKPSPAQFNKICKILDLSFDNIKEVEREVIGTKKAGMGTGKSFGTVQTGLNADKSINSGVVDVTVPSTDKAKEFAGAYAGCNLKPAVEPIFICMKPLSEKSYTDQVLANGKGCTWLDDCRIPAANKAAPHKSRKSGTFAGGALNSALERPQIDTKRDSRFPANLLVSDDVLNDGGKQSFSRFFDLDAWARENKLPMPDMFGETAKSIRDTLPFLCVPKPTRKERDKGCETLNVTAKSDVDKISGGKCKMKTGLGNDRNTLYLNNHPTVKPLRLFHYLITLTTRKGDIVLDPFLGSGTTALAAKLCGRKYIGYEKDKDYFEICERRIKNV